MAEKLLQGLTYTSDSKLALVHARWSSFWEYSWQGKKNDKNPKTVWKSC